MVCGCSTQQHSKDSGCRLDNEPGSREFPTSIEGRGTSLDAIQDTASKCQRINIPFTHTRQPQVMTCDAVYSISWILTFEYYLTKDK